jgi:hypothetical protein
VKAEAAVLVAEGMPKAEAARELGIARESLRRISQDPLWQHWLTNAKERLVRGVKFQAIVRDLLDTRTCPEDEERQAPYSEMRDGVIAVLQKSNVTRLRNGMETYTATAEAIDVLITHHLGHRIEEDERAAKFALIDLIAGTLGNEAEDDDDDPSTETWTAEKMQREVKNGAPK